jgi:hypothetical protein
MTVLAGGRLLVWKYVFGPPDEEKRLLVFWPAACELSWLKARTEERLRAGAEVNCGLHVRIRPEQVEAARRVRKAIVKVDKCWYL